MTGSPVVKGVFVSVCDQPKTAKPERHSLSSFPEAAMAQQPPSAEVPNPEERKFDESEFWSFEGYPLDLRVKPESHEEVYCCVDCKKLARVAVEVSCETHYEENPHFNPRAYCAGLAFQ